MLVGYHHHLHFHRFKGEKGLTETAGKFMAICSYVCIYRDHNFVVMMQLYYHKHLCICLIGKGECNDLQIY